MVLKGWSNSVHGLNQFAYSRGGGSIGIPCIAFVAWA